MQTFGVLQICCLHAEVSEVVVTHELICFFILMLDTKWHLTQCSKLNPAMQLWWHLKGIVWCVGEILLITFLPRVRWLKQLLCLSIENKATSKLSLAKDIFWTSYCLLKRHPTTIWNKIFYDGLERMERMCPPQLLKNINFSYPINYFRMDGIIEMHIGLGLGLVEADLTFEIIYT